MSSESLMYKTIKALKKNLTNAEKQDNSMEKKTLGTEQTFIIGYLYDLVGLAPSSDYNISYVLL